MDTSPFPTQEGERTLTPGLCPCNPLPASPNQPLGSSKGSLYLMLSEKGQSIQDLPLDSGQDKELPYPLASS